MGIQEAESISKAFELVFGWIISWPAFQAVSTFFEGLYAIQVVKIVTDFVLSLPGINQLIELHKFMYGNLNFEIYRVIVWIIVLLAIGQIAFYYIRWGIVWSVSIAAGRNSNYDTMSYWDEFDPEVHQDKPVNFLAYIISPLMLVTYRAMQFLRLVLAATVWALSAVSFAYIRFILSFHSDYLSRVVIASTELETRYTQRNALASITKQATAQSRASKLEAKRDRKALNQTITKLTNKNAELEAIIKLANARNKPPSAVMSNLRNYR